MSDRPPAEPGPAGEPETYQELARRLFVTLPKPFRIGTVKEFASERTVYLDLEDVVTLVRGLKLAIRDLGLLDSSLARPRASVFGMDAYPYIDIKAAALLESIARNHALIDGNKRLAWLVTVVFLRLNGFRPGLSHNQAFDLVMDVAQGSCGLAEAADRLQVGPLGET